jgi:CRISPR-associated protein Cmr6
MNRERYQPQRIRPVYANGLQDIFRPRPPATANIGLLYDRYADIWSGPAGRPAWKPETPKNEKSMRQQFLDEVIEHVHKLRPHIGPLLEAHHKRREELWSSLNTKVVRKLNLVAPFVSGLGMAHSLEVGFIWDHNLGVPYLPGTGLKGLARAWAKHWKPMSDETDFLRIFGDLNDFGAGSIVFHALYPLEPPELRLDLLNPHFKEYYEENKDPGDWCSPTPVFFLTVPPGTTFITAIHARPNRAKPGDLEKAEQCLLEALANLGAGAKTAVGYGYFEQL